MGLKMSSTFCSTDISKRYAISRLVFCTTVMAGDIHSQNSPNGQDFSKDIPVCPICCELCWKKSPCECERRVKSVQRLGYNIVVFSCTESSVLFRYRWVSQRDRMLLVWRVSSADHHISTSSHFHCLLACCIDAPLSPDLLRCASCLVTDWALLSRCFLWPFRLRNARLNGDLEDKYGLCWMRTCCRLQNKWFIIAVVSVAIRVFVAPRISYPDEVTGLTSRQAYT